MLLLPEVEPCTAALPGHERCWGGHTLRALRGVEPGAAFGRPQGVIVLHPKTTKDLQAAVIQVHGQRDPQSRIGNRRMASCNLHPGPGSQPHPREVSLHYAQKVEISH